MIDISLVTSNIVILAENHNPAIASVEWLKKKRVFDEDPSNYTNTPMFSFFESQNYYFVVDPNRLQIALKKVSDSYIPKLVSAASAYVKALPETPYKAMGLNFIWVVYAKDEKNASQIMKRAFMSNSKRIEKAIETDSYLVGSILIFKREPFLLRLVIEQSQKSNSEISCSFNYHADVKTSTDVQKIILDFEARKEESNKILCDLFT